MRLALLAGSLAVAAMLTAGCTENAPSAGTDARRLTVTATDDACRLSAATAPSGTLTFAVTNSGAKVNEFYLLASDGLRIVAEVENIGPGLTRELVLSAPPGAYLAVCKPGMVGEGIRVPFEVTDSGSPVEPTGDGAALVERANAAYGSYVKDQTEQLLARTEEFAALYKAGDDDAARALYAPARVHWERIETVAESFGDLDPKMDAREADLAEGETWTGWHRIEKDLWPQRAQRYKALTTSERTGLADALVADTRELYGRTRELTYTVDGIANGAKGLLDEVASGKVTGEEEFWTRTDLWDFQANIDGARVAWEGLRPILQRQDRALDARIAAEFGDLQEMLDRHRRSDGFVTYDQLGSAEVKELSDAVNALSEPLSKLAAAVLA